MCAMWNGLKALLPLKTLRCPLEPIIFSLFLSAVPPSCEFNFSRNWLSVIERCGILMFIFWRVFIIMRSSLLEVTYFNFCSSTAVCSCLFFFFTTQIPNKFRCCLKQKEEENAIICKQTTFTDDRSACPHQKNYHASRKWKRLIALLLGGDL